MSAPAAPPAHEQVDISSRGTSGVDRRPPRAPGGAGTPSRRRATRLALGLIAPLALLALWQGVVSAGVYNRVQLPGPLVVAAAGGDLWERGLLQAYIAISTQRVVVGFVVGTALGLAAGAVVGLSRLADGLLAPTIGAFRAVPSLAWVPLLILWMGIGEDSKITLIAIGAFFPVYTTAASALRHVDRHLVEAGRAFGLRGVAMLLTVQLPAAVPGIIAGVRLALAQAWLFLVAAELIASTMGLGFLLQDSGNNGRTDRILLAIIVLALLGTLTDALVGLFERWALRRWA